MQSQLDNSRYARSILSTSTRRDVLWNVSEPGDPYDIKKSMIAKLPGDKKVFMGDQLELVCLLQAAEIERLCQFLDQYRLKFREIERNNLDRHSYEVQIKELTERLNGEEALRNENNKLKDFSKRLQVEIETLQRSSRETSLLDESSKANYDRTLERITSLTAENQQLRRQIEEYRFQLQSSSARLEALERAKNREIEELKLSYSQLTREAQETALSAMRAQAQAQVRRLEFELKRARELNDSKNLEISELQGRVRKLQEDAERAGQHDQYSYQLEAQVREYENKFVIFGTQIERLNIALRDYNAKLEDSERRRRELDGRTDHLQQLSQDLEGRLRQKDQEISRLSDLLNAQQAEVRTASEATQLIAQYESRLTLLLRENENLLGKLKIEVEGSRKLREEAERLNFENSKYKLLEREVQTLREGSGELPQLKKKLAELENRNAILGQELQRLQSSLKSRDAQLEKGRSVLLQNEALKSRITQLEYSYSSRSEVEISRIKSQYEQRLEALSRSQGNELNSKLQLYEGQLDRLKATLKLKTEENDKQRTRIYELQASANRADFDTNSKLKNYQLAINNLKRENQEQYSRLKAAGETERRVIELQTRMAQAQREAERANLTLRTRQEEILALRTKLRQLESVAQKQEFDSNKVKLSYDQTVVTLRSENETLNRKLADLVNESNRKLKEASQEIDLLGNTLRSRTEERVQFQARVKLENDELRRRVAELEARGNATVNSLSQENELLKKQLADLRNQGNLLEFQNNKKISILQQNNAGLARDNEDLKRRVTDYEARITLASQEIERLGFQLKTKIDELTLLRTEYDKFKAAFKQYENDVNSHMQGEVMRRFKEYQQRLQEQQQRTQEQQQKVREVSLENDELKRRLNDGTNKLSQQLERLTATLRQTTTEREAAREQLRKQSLQWQEESIRYQTSIKQLTWEKETVTRQFKEYEVSVSQKLEGDIQRKITAYQENITRLTNDNNDLRRKLQEVGVDFSRRLAEAQSKYLVLTQQYQKLRGTANALVQQNDSLRRKGVDLEGTISNYEAEVKRRIGNYEQTVSSLNKENEELRRRLQEAGDLSRRFAQYQSRIALLSQELQRLTNALKLATQENEALRKQLNERHALSTSYQLEVSRKVSTYESNLNILQRENEDLKKRLTASDQRIRTLTQQFQKVSAAYKLKSEEYANLQISIKNYQAEVKKNFTANDQSLNVLARENEELKRRVNQLSDATRRLQEYENRMALLSQELERLGSALKNKQEDYSKLQVTARNQANELDGWRRKYAELEANYSNTYEIEVKKKYASYEQTISEFNRRNTETEGKLNSSIQEIQRLNNILRLKVDESTQQTIQLKTLSAEREEIIRKLRDSDAQNARRAQELETYASQIKGQSDSKLRMVNGEIQRLTTLLKTRTDENDALRRQFKEYELAFSQRLEEANSRLAQYDSNSRKDSDELRRRVQEVNDLSRKLAEYQNKIVLLSQEMERLNVIISTKIDEQQKAAVQNEELRRQNEELRRRLADVTNDTSRRIPEYEQRLALLMQENEKLQLALRSKTDELGALDLRTKQFAQDNETLRRNITNLEQSWNSKHQTEISRRTQTYEQTINVLTREKDDQARKRAETEARLAQISQEVERLTLLINKQTEEYERLKREYVSLQSNTGVVGKEYETAKRHLQEYEQSIRKLYTEFQRLQGIINELKKENQTLHTMNHNLSSEINRLTLQNKDLEQQASEVRLRLSDETALQKRISEHLALMVVLFAEIETLRQRVKDKEKEVAEVRRSSLAPNIL